ncbi:hypothetical protein ACFRKE_09700 [Kitasatospora indigofera]|uniref:hypothetical protein n=1 Tax=Kitasatospora indigofera TaxID=67307 RepID=UPI00368DBBE9
MNPAIGARIEELVGLLGGAWHPAPCPYGQDDVRQYVTDGRGRGFWMCVDRRQAKRESAPWRQGWDGAQSRSVRVDAFGRYPEVPGHFTDGARPRIGFDLMRPLSSLAKDVRRRFLPQFEAAHARAVNELHARSSAAELRAALAESLTARFPQRGWHGELRPGVHRVSVDLEPHPGACADMEVRKAAELVDVQLRNVDPRDLEMLWALFEQRQAERLAAAQCKDASILDIVLLN